jgi:hypothetical protein
LAKPFTTVCTDPFYGQTSGPRPPKFSQADPKLDVESLLPKKLKKKISRKKFQEKKFKKKISRKKFQENNFKKTISRKSFKK